jgi:hypothetical protein
MKQENKTSPQKNIREERKKKGILSVYQYSNGTLRANPFTRAILLAFYVKEKPFQQDSNLSITHPLGKVPKEDVSCWLDYSNVFSIADPYLLSSTL